MARRKDKSDAGPASDNVVPIGAARRARLVTPVPKQRDVAPSTASATAALDKAMRAKTPQLRIRHARAGLVRNCDVETQGLLLRQLYLGELESGKYDRARQVAEQLIELNVLPDVAQQDAARACQAMGDYDAAIEHLKIAARIGPPARKAFHLSTLGGLLYAIGRARDAIGPLQRALEGGASAAALIRGQLALARATNEDDAELDLAYHDLAADPSGEGYGRFVLGELAFARGDRRRAQIHLEAFLGKVRRSRPAAQAALSPEVARATTTLGRIVWN